MVGARLQRKYIYAFSAVSPHDGVMDSLVLPWVNAQAMSLFLAEVAQRHAEEFVVMVMAPRRRCPGLSNFEQPGLRVQSWCASV